MSVFANGPLLSKYNSVYQDKQQRTEHAHKINKTIQKQETTKTDWDQRLNIVLEKTTKIYFNQLHLEWYQFPNKWNLVKRFRHISQLFNNFIYLLLKMYCLQSVLLVVISVAYQSFCKHCCENIYQTYK